jgi:zinc transport system permease protein
MDLSIFKEAFIQRALILGSLTAISCSLLGVYLILRQSALIGDGIAHIAFGGIALGLVFNLSPFFSALVVAILGSLAILRLKKRAKIGSDTAIGILSHSSLGIGIFITSMGGGSNVDILSYLFGNILLTKDSEVIATLILTLLVIGTIVLYYQELLYLSFDEDAAQVAGIKTDFINGFLIILTAFTVVTSMRVVGLMLASALIILPAASALQIKTSFQKTLITAALIGIISIAAGIIAAIFFDLAVSGSIILANAVIFLGLYLLRQNG